MRTLHRVLALVGMAFGVFAPSAFSQGNVLLREIVSREYALHVGGVESDPVKQAVSREISISIEPGRADFSQVISREYDVVIVSNAPPPVVTGLTVSSSPTGDAATLDWSTYNQLAVGDIVRFEIYFSDSGPITDVTGLTPYRTVGAGTTSLSLTGLTPFQDHFFAIVAVDGLGNFIPLVNYAAAYVLSPQLVSRELSLSIGGETVPLFKQVVSREMDLVIVSAAAPPAITGATVTSSPSGDSATLDWSAYNQLAVGDIVRFDIYFSDSGAFTDVTGMTPYASVGGGATSFTLNGLTPGRDHYFAIVAVDGLGNFIPLVNYSAAYVLSPQVVSREVSLFIGGETLPPYKQAVSREISFVVPDAAIPAPVTGVGSGFTAITSTTAFGAVDLDWTSYNELAQNDVVRYRIYVANAFFDTVTGLGAPREFMQSGQQRATISGLTGLGIFHFAVVAEDALGQFNPVVRSFSAQASISGVGEVLNLTGTSGANSITYAWQPPTDAGPFLRGYRIYFNGSTVPVELTPTENSWMATGLAPATGYAFRITTLDPFGGESGGVSLLGATLLPNPGGVQLTARNGEVVLLWNAAQPVALVSFYEVYRSVAPFTNISAATKIAAGPALEATLGSFAAVSGFHYAVVTVNVLGGTNPVVTSVHANKQPQTIDFPQPVVVGSAPVALLATSSSGLPVRFEAVPPELAQINAVPQLVALSGGRVTVTAFQDGNANFWPADSVSRFVRQLPLFTSFTANGLEITGTFTLRAIDEELRAIALDADGISRAEFFIRPAGNGTFTSLGVDLIPGNGFSANLPLDAFADGAYQLKVAVETPEAIANEIVRSVTLQLAPPPAPVLTAPADGINVELAPITVFGTTVRASQVFILRNGVEIAGPLDPDAAGLFSTQITLLPGANILTVRASNRAGTGALSPPRTVTLNPGPIIAGTTFRGAPIAEGATVTTSGKFGVVASDSDGIERAEFFYKPALSVFRTSLGTDSNPADGLDALWNVENLSDGPFDLIARVFDRLGAFTEIIRRVNLTLVAPAAPVILTPLDGTTVQPATITVTGTAPVFPALRIYRNGERVFTGAAQSNGTFSASVPLVDGQNLLYAESANRAGASAPSNPVLVTRMAVLPVLSVTLAPATVVEGASRDGTVSISTALALPLTISLTSSRATRLGVPETVTIEAGQTSVGFTAQALQNQSVELPASVAVSAGAAGFDGASASLQVLDDDQPTIALALDRASVSERDGSPALHGTITLDRTIAFPLRMIFAATPETDVILPPQVEIPANSLGAIFPIGVVNNVALDGSRDVAIVAYLVESSGANTVAQSAPATLTIHDDDGPALALAVDRTLLVEGANPAATATVSRSPVTGGAVFVTLASSDTGEMTAPVSVTIPAGQASISFPLQAVADGTTDGNQPATLTTSASGFSPASKILTVTDLQKPDLFVDLIAPPAGAETDAWIDVRILLRNQGAVDAQGPYTQRIYLSTDALPGDDILLTQANFAGRLLAGFSIEQSLRVKLPRTAGRFWLVAETDANLQLDEALEDNNTAISATPVDIEPAYTTTLAIAPETVPSATPIPITGTATLRAGGPAAFVLVNIHIAHGTVNRVISALTNSVGQYSTTFTPLPGDGGLFEFFATHPGTDTAPVQDSVKVYGLGSEPASLDLRLSENSSQPGVFTITNLTDLPLTGLQAAVTGAPAGITFTPTLAATNLAGNGTVALNYTLTTTTPLARTTFTVSLTSTEGAALQIPVAIAVIANTPQLVAEPAELVAGMLRGQQHISTFIIRNNGSAPTGPVNLLLPPGAPWMRAATSLPVPPLAPGASVPMTIQLTPPADLPLQEYSGNLVATDGAIYLSIPYRFRALSDQMGQVIVRTEDEYTYYATGNPPLAGATVRVIDALTRLTVGTLVSDANGVADFGPLREGYYEIEATAGQHATYRATHLIQPGTPNNIQAFLSRETVSYTWTVVPVQIEDRYKVTIDTTFETVVPIPVVTVEPNVIDLAEITVDETVVNIKVTNHGLLAADNTQFAVPSHPLWEFTPAIDAIGVLPAKSSITVPMRIRRITAVPPPPAFGGPAPAPDPGPCHISATVCWELICGKFKNTYCAVLSMPNARGGCGGIAPTPTGGGCTNCGGQIGPGSGSTGVGVTLVCNPDCYVLAALGCIPGPVGCFFSGYSCGQGLAGGVSFGSVFDCAVGAAGCLIPAASIPACIYDLTKCLIGTFGGGGPAGSPPPPPDGSQALGADPLSQFKPGVRAMVDVFNEITGAPDGVWLNAQSGSPTGDWYARFQLATAESSDGGREVTAAERAALLSGAQPPGVAAAEVNRLIDRTNRSLVNFARGLLRRADAPAGESLDFIDLTELQRLLRLAGDYQTIAENAGFTDPFNAIVETVRIRQNLGESGGICGRIKLRLEQEAVLTRDAFLATLDIENKTPAALASLRVNVTVRAESGADATTLFDIGTPVLAGVTAVDGTGVLAGNSNGSAKWTIIPTVDAAPTVPVRFFVSGTLSYRVDELDITIPFSEIAITVLPSPRLVLKYFHQRDVFSDDPFTTPIEPAIPYVLAVMVENQGFGAANNFTISSAQPRIIENEKGLLADFQIIATKVDGQPLQPSLTANFGDIAPGQIRIGEWFFTSSLQGLFTDYSATFEHIDGRGNPRLSLIDSVEIHEMIHEVRELGLLDDGKPDFLVNDLGDARNLPDTLYLSDGTTAPVAVLEAAQVTGTLSPANLSIGLTAAMPAGWAYLLVPEPSNGQYVLQRVVRSDGLEIPIDVNAWVTDRTFIGQGLRPNYENVLHLLDENSPGNYTLIYALAAGLDTQTPVSRVLPLPAQSALEFPVSWEGTDDRRVAGFDVYVSVNGGAFTRWLQGSRDTGAVYVGALGSSYAFYTRAFDAAGNVEAAPAIADATTAVTIANIPPALAVVPDQDVNEGGTLTLQLTANDPDGRADLLRYSFVSAVPPGLTIDAQTGILRWATGEADGGRTETVQVRVTDSGVPAQSATRTFLLRVPDTNQPPVFAPVEPQRIAPGSPLTVQLSATDGDLPAQTIRYRFTSPTPATMMLDVVTGAITWTPAIADADRTLAVAVTAADNGTPVLETTVLVSITVDPANLDRAPQFLASPAQLWFIGTTRTLEIGAFDPDGDAVTMALNGPGLPAGLSLSSTPGTGRALLSWNTTGLTPGVYALPIRATAGAAQSLYAPTVKLVNDNVYWRWADANLGGLADLASADPTQDPDGDGTGNIHEWTFLRDPLTTDATRTQLALEGPYEGGFYFANVSVHRRRGSNQFVTLIPQSSATLAGGTWTDLPSTDYDATLDPNGDDDGDPETEEVSIRVLFQLTLDGLNDKKFFRIKSATRPTLP